MKFLFALLVAISLSAQAHEATITWERPTPTLAQTSFTGPQTFGVEAMDNLFVLHLSAWKLACAMKKIRCEMYAMPYVAYSLLGARFGQYTTGEKIVLVDLRLLAQPLALTVMIHEMIHYIQFVTGQAVPGTNVYMQRCVQEQEAYDLVFELNRTMHITDDPRLLSWKQAATIYGCPEPAS